MPQIRPPRTSHPRRTRARTASPTTAASAAPTETRVRSNEDLQIDPRNAKPRHAPGPGPTGILPA